MTLAAILYALAGIGWAVFDWDAISDAVPRHDDVSWWHRPNRTAAFCLAAILWPVLTPVSLLAHATGSHARPVPPMAPFRLGFAFALYLACVGVLVAMRFAPR